MDTLFKNNTEEKALYLFEQISRIPRGSGREKAISDYIREKAEQRGLWCFQDDCWNLIIKKPASEGCESLPPVILQAHMDMVCEKNSNSTHDFLRDPIPLEIDGDWLRSAAGTTLGADDGIGVAMCVAALLSEDLVHPPLEVLLTVQEESTFYGAENVRWDLLEGRRLINLDQSVEQEVLAGSCGGSGVEMILPMERQDIPPDMKCCQLTIRGMCGGHSGEDIHRGFGSAIQLMIRVLRHCRNSFGALLVSMDAGTSRLAISREAQAVICSSEDFDRLREELHRLELAFRREYQAVAPMLTLTLSEASPEPEGCFDGISFEKLLAALTLFPDGIQKMNGGFPGTVESSINLGVIKTEPVQSVLNAEIRGGYASTVADIKDKVSALGSLLGAECRFYTQYTPWEYRRESPLRAAAARSYRRLFDRELKVCVVHAGIECGCFLQKIPELDAISLGPDCQYFHSPQERMSISSAKRCWQFLQELLRDLACKCS